MFMPNFVSWCTILIAVSGNRGARRIGYYKAGSCSCEGGPQSALMVIPYATRFRDTTYFD